MKTRLACVLSCVALAGCAARPVPALPLIAEVEPYGPPMADTAQIVFLSPADAPTPADTNALYELEPGRRVLVAALAAHAGWFARVKPGHHVFMTVGRAAHLLEANVDGGARYYVLLRSDGGSELVAWPLRMTDDTPLSNRNPDSGRWIMSSRMVDKTAAADAWFAAQASRVDAAQAAALAAWQASTPQERAARTLQREDACLR